MQISDDLMYRYYELLTDQSVAEIGAMRKKIESGALHPMEAKALLARRIVTDFHSAGAANEAADVFRKVVQQGQVPDDMPTHALPETMRGETSIRMDKLLREINLCGSGAEANRKLKEGAVSVNGEKHREMSYEIGPGAKELTIQVGKKWARVKLGA
jgi:tyrosyl-tRNA synthetase